MYKAREVSKALFYLFCSSEQKDVRTRKSLNKKEALGTIGRNTQDNLNIKEKIYTKQPIKKVADLLEQERELFIIFIWSPTEQIGYTGHVTGPIPTGISQPD